VSVGDSEWLADRAWVNVYFGPSSIVIAAAAWKGFGCGDSGATTLTSLDEDDVTIGQVVLDTVRSNPRQVELEEIPLIKRRSREIGAMLGSPGMSANTAADSALLEFIGTQVVATLWKARRRSAVDALRLGTPADDAIAIGALVRLAHQRLSAEPPPGRK